MYITSELFRQWKHRYIHFKYHWAGPSSNKSYAFNTSSMMYCNPFTFTESHFMLPLLKLYSPRQLKAVTQRCNDAYLASQLSRISIFPDPASTLYHLPTYFFPLTPSRQPCDASRKGEILASGSVAQSPNILLFKCYVCAAAGAM